MVRLLGLVHSLEMAPMLLGEENEEKGLKIFLQESLNPAFDDP